MSHNSIRSEPYFVQICSNNPFNITQTYLKLRQHSAGPSHNVGKQSVIFCNRQFTHKGESKIIRIFPGNSGFRASSSSSSVVGDDGDALLDDGGLALPVGQPELGAEEDVLAVGVEVNRQRDGRLLQENGAQLNSDSTRGMGLVCSKLWN